MDGIGVIAVGQSCFSPSSIALPDAPLESAVHAAPPSRIVASRDEKGRAEHATRVGVIVYAGHAGTVDLARFRPVSDEQQLLASRPGGQADGVPDPGTARGVGRGRRGFPRRAQAACASRRAPPPPQRGRSRRPADRRALGRGLARGRRRRAARQRLAASQGASAGRADDQIARLRHPGRARRARSPPLRAAGGRGEEPACSRPGGRRVGAAARRAVAVERPGARGLRLRELRPGGHRPARGDQAGSASSSGSTPTSRSGATTSWSGSSRHSSPSTRSASACGGI